MNSSPVPDAGMRHPSSVAILRTDSLGDVVLTLPMARSIKQQAPETRVILVVREYTAPLVRCSPWVDAVLAIPTRDVGHGWPAFGRRLRAECFDAAVFAHPRPGLAAAVRVAGIPRRVGTAYRWYSPLFTDRVREHRRASLLHESEYNLHLLRPLGFSADAGRGPLLEISDTLRRSAAGRLESLGIPAGAPLVVLHPGSLGSARDWDAASFGHLGAALLRAMPGISVLITGTGAEAETLRSVASYAGPRAAVFIGDDGVDHFAAVLQQADLCVANSTGPLHIASALDVPVLGLYPFETVCHPRRWGPLGVKTVVLTPEPDPDCPACRKGSCARHDDMARIPIDRVVDTAIRSLAGTIPGA